mmetsp:Transcript_33351/g.61220  ORF Transcript_33351/g.61220 Transcript_33351/m.61220 type:complete len:224 (+) Transcript_33351:720-1391(+)
MGLLQRPPRPLGHTPIPTLDRQGRRGAHSSRYVGSAAGRIVRRHARQEGGQAGERRADLRQEVLGRFGHVRRGDGGYAEELHSVRALPCAVRRRCGVRRGRGRGASAARLRGDGRSGGGTEGDRGGPSRGHGGEPRPRRRKRMPHQVPIRVRPASFGRRRRGIIVDHGVSHRRRRLQGGLRGPVRAQHRRHCRSHDTGQGEHLRGRVQFELGKVGACVSIEGE